MERFMANKIEEISSSEECPLATVHHTSNPNALLIKDCKVMLLSHASTNVVRYQRDAKPTRMQA